MVDKLVPTKVGDDVWLKVTAGDNHTCAIMTNGNLYCWGSNNAGKLGDGYASAYKTTPMQVGNDTWKMVTAGYSHTCGIKMDNKLYCWGGNSVGQLGDNTTTDKFVPTKIGDDSWLQISAGSWHTCGIKTDNKLYCWGDNGSGQLGDGTAGINTNKLSPVLIGNDTWSEISSGKGFGKGGGSTILGNTFTCGIKSDKKLYCWGSNADAQLGIGVYAIQDCPYPYDCSDKNVPTKVNDDSWSKITTGWRRACAIKDKELFCWGNGMLGIGGAGNRTVPSRVVD